MKWVKSFVDVFYRFHQFNIATIGPLVSEKLASRLLNGISRTGSEEVKRECLDNMSDLLRYAPLILSVCLS